MNHQFLRILFSVFFFSAISFKSNAQCVADSLELYKFHTSTAATWTFPWNTSKPLKEWEGVRLDANGCVDTLVLSGQNIYGKLINFNLPQLRYLILSANFLSGTVPNFNLPNLEYLDLSSNELSGAIPAFDLPKLKGLYLGSNNLKSVIPAFKLPNLESLNLSDNGFIGLIPNFNLPKLYDLSLRKNHFEPDIPNFDLPNLEYLNLAECGLAWDVPDFNLPKLRYLNLTGNKLTGIPNFKLPNLEELNLYLNELNCEIPDFDLPNLEILDISFNQMVGSIPDFKLPKVTTIDLQHNQLSDSIPNFKLPYLRELNLSNNQLKGNVPNFEYLPHLAYLYLRKNKLTGSISSFTSPYLSSISISNNQLTGTIPNFKLPYLNALWLYNNQLDSCTTLSLPKEKFNTIALYGNKLTFNDLLLNKNVTYEYLYNTQDSCSTAKNIIGYEQQPIQIDCGVDQGIATNQYQWYKEAILLPMQKKRALTFASLDLNDAGVYYCKITNPQLPNLTLVTRPVTLDVQEFNAVKEEEKNTFLVTVFPNPVQKEVIFVFEKELPSEKITLVLTNALGQIVYTNTVEQDRVSIDRGNLASGIYFYQCYQNGKRKAIGKLILE